MKERHDMTQQEYQLRHAAGLYWLIDTEQPGIPYKKPIPMNDVGAEIWKLLAQGMIQEQIADILSKQYSISKAEAVQDMEQFIKQLEDQGVKL